MCHNRKFCSSKCYWEEMKDNKKYYPTNIDQLKEMSIATHGNREKQLDRTPWNKGLKMPEIAGKNSPHWIGDRSKLAKKQERNDSAYKEWRTKVCGRDNWKCKIADKNCDGKVVVHHILPWAKFPELRYELNNGITLCQFHHPRKRNDEMILSPYFQELVMVKAQ